jgi:predicted lipid-binding transport protein (Tim44 family)
MIAAIASVALIATGILQTADARVGGGGSFGSRGARTWSAPPATSTSPTARPIERSMTQPSQSPGQVGSPGYAPRPGLFGGGRGLLGGLAAGFLGAGLLGMLFGGGFWSGLGSFAGFLGLLIQLALIVFVARLAWSWWQRRNQPAYAGGPAPRGNPLNFGLGGLAGSGGGAAPATAPLTITADDYNSFERLLGDVQSAYSREDLGALRSRVTPEMLSYFSEDLARNASRGMVNEVSGVKLLKGDLAESWREGDTDYATVAMQFSLVDKYIDRASGHLVEGSDQPQVVTEIWTFRRSRGGDWLLAAIQQT